MTPLMTGQRSSTHPTLPDDNRRDKDDINNDNLNDEDEDDVIVEYSLADAHSSLPADCPFFFLYLSSEDSTREDPSHDTAHDASLPESSSTRQGTTHVSVTADEVLRSSGEVRRKWIGAGKTELDNLTNTNTITRLSPEQRDEIKRKARSKGQKYIELPAKAVFTIKPSKFKIRIVACGNKTDETFGRTSTTDLDTGMLRYLVSWAASLPNFLGFTGCYCCFPQCTFTNWTHCCTSTSNYPLQTQSSTSWSCMAKFTRPFTDFERPPVYGQKSERKL